MRDQIAIGAETHPVQTSCNVSASWQRDADAMFPLATTPFERYMIADDHASHPMGAFMEIELRGHLDLAHLVRSFDAAIARHPLLRAGIRLNLLGHPCWVAVAPSAPDVAELGVPITCADGERLDLKTGSGMRCWIRHAPQRTQITLQVHHACSDALGKLTFLADWLTIAAGPGAESLPPPDWQSLRTRGHSPRASRSERSAAKAPGVVSDITRFLWRRTRPLPNTQEDTATGASELSGLCSASVDDAVFQRLRKQAKALGVTVNDWLLAALFVAMKSWIDDSDSSTSPGVYRVVVPFNMRPANQIAGPACNRIGYEFLSHHMNSDTDMDTLCRHISRFTAPVRKLRNSTFLKTGRIVARLPGVTALLMRNWRRTFATVVFSNLGDVGKFRSSHPDSAAAGNGWAFGDVTVDRIACAPPTRPGIHLAMVALRYGEQLHFCARCEGRVLSAKSTQQFLQHYRDTVIAMAAGSADP